MNLVQELIKDLLPEQEYKKKVAVYGGGFKPPTKGHFEVVKQAIEENPDIDEFIINIGGKERDGVTPEEAIQIWDIYKQYLPVSANINIQYSNTPPIKATYDYAKNNPDEEVLFILGAREGNEDDFKDISIRTKSLDKYPNLNLRTIVTQGAVSGTAAREAGKISSEKLRRYLPDELKDEEVEQVYQMISGKLDEGRKKKKDPKKGTGKKPKGSGRRLYTDEDPKDTVGIKFSTRQDIVDTLNKKSFKAKSHARQSQIINLIHQRVRAALGRTKDPAKKKKLKSGFEYIKKRKEASKRKTQRLKKQKLNEKLCKRGKAYIAKRKREGEKHNPFLAGRAVKVCKGQIRGSDGKKKKDFRPKKGKTRSAQGRKPDIVKEIGIELSNYSGQVLPGDVLRAPKGFPLGGKKLESSKQLKVIKNSREGVNRYKLSLEDSNGKRYTVRNFQMDGEYKGKKYPKWGMVRRSKKNLNESGYEEAWELLGQSVPEIQKFVKEFGFDNNDKTAKKIGAIIDNIKDTSLAANKIPNLKNLANKGNDVKTLKAIKQISGKPDAEQQYVKLMQARDAGEKRDRGYDVSDLIKSVKSGNYESPVLLQLSSDLYVIGGRTRLYAALALNIPVKVKIISRDTFKQKLNEQIDSSQFNFKPYIASLTKYFLDNKMALNPLPKIQLIHDDINNGMDVFGKTAYYVPNTNDIVLFTYGRHPKDILRSYAHELVHVHQKNENRLENYGTTNVNQDDHLEQIEREAYETGNILFRSWTDSLNDRILTEGKNKKYKHKFGFDPKLGKDPFGLNAYARELAMGLEEQVSDYKVYLDMDGVLADFDQRFRDISGMEPKEFEAKYGNKAFWNLIDEENKISFWVGIKPMPGAADLVKAVKKYNYELLTSPSAKKQSYLGKILWVRNHSDILGGKPRINFKKAKEKHQVKPELSQTDILIDDREDTIGRWNAAGGTGIVYKSIGQVLNDLKKLGL